MKMFRIITFTALLLIMAIAVAFFMTGCTSATKESSEEVSEVISKEFAEESSREISIEVSDELSKENSTKSSEEPSKQVSEETSLAPSEEPSTEVSEEQFFEEYSKEASGEASIEVSDEASEDTPSAPSVATSEEPSTEVSKEVSIVVSEEVSIEATSEELSEEQTHVELPSDVEVGYIVYDIFTDSITSSANINQEFRTCCTIKAAYVLWLFDSGKVTQKDMDTISLKYNKPGKKEDFEGTSVLWNKGISDGAMISLKSVLEYTIKYSDNLTYVMLTDYYGYSGFNDYMNEKGINVRLGSKKTGGVNYTNASAAEQLEIWKLIYNFCFPADGEVSYEAKKLKSWLIHDKTNSFIKQAYPGLDTINMCGWANTSGTLNDCAIIKDENGNPQKIVIILTSDGKNTEDLKRVHVPRFIKIAQKVIDTIIVL